MSTSDKPIDSWRARAAVSEALEVFNSSYLQEIWSKALARRENDPEGAVTSARQLLETICKYILDEAEKEYKDGLPLPQLYRLTAEVLDIAPTPEIEEVFKSVFSSCAEIISGVGKLRNYLSDSHGRGPFGTMPDWRHAELAVNLSAAMATYLAAVWKGRQPTVSDVIHKYIETTEQQRSMGSTHRYALLALAQKPIGNLIASKLQVSDVIAHCESRRALGTAPATINQDIVYLRGALGSPSDQVFDDALSMLRHLKLVGKSVARSRISTSEEFDALIAHFREQDKHWRTVIPMHEIIEFAVWSGRSISEICSMRWADANLTKQTCKLPGGKEAFPLLGKAWEIVEARSRVKEERADARIFQYNSKSASGRFTLAVKELRNKSGGAKFNDLRLHDFRYEAVTRLLDKGYQPHEVSRATGQDIKRVMQIWDQRAAPSS